MHIFYTPDIDSGEYTMTAEESKHCIRVLRLKEGDKIQLVDGKGNYYVGRIINAQVRGCEIEVEEKQEEYGKREFHLHIAIAPTKNTDRLEWMLEKCTEIGVDEVTLLKTARSERKVIKRERLEKVIISAMKQSLKAYLPRLNEITDFKTLIEKPFEGQKFIAHCIEEDKKRLDEIYLSGHNALILIGPEGDFTEEEVNFAIKNGFQPVSLGNSRLRTETAGLVACHSINFLNKV